MTGSTKYVPCRAQALHLRGSHRMPAIWQARSGGVGNLVLAGALALGLSGRHPRHAQQPGGAAKRSPRAEVQKPGPPAREQDAGSLRARWRAQQIAARKAEAEYRSARLARECAEIAVHVYIECIFPRELASIGAEVKLAEANLTEANNFVDWTEKIREKGYLLLVVGGRSREFEIKKAKFALEQAQGKKKVLVDYTKPRMIKALKSDVGKTRSEELAKKAAWLREKATEAELGRQLEP